MFFFLRISVSKGDGHLIFQITLHYILHRYIKALTGKLLYDTSYQHAVGDCNGADAYGSKTRSSNC